MNGQREYETQIADFGGRGDRLWTVADLLDQPTPQWLVQDILIEKTFNVLVGKPGVGKSFFALETALSIATGEKVLDSFDVKQGPVVYVVAEGVAGMGPRVRAWLDAKDIDYDPDVFFLPRALQLTEPEDAERLVALCEQTLSAPPRLVVIDTMARCMKGDENSSEDVGRFVENVVWVQTQLGKYGSCASLVVHHPAKGTDTERGSGALTGAADCIGLLKDSPEGVTLYCRKQKDAMPWTPVRFRLQPQGDSCILAPPLITMHRTDGNQLTTPSELEGSE